MSLFKQRFFWTGLGSGIVAGALLLQLMTASNHLRHEQNTAELLSELQSWDDATWQAYAEQAGYTLHSSDTVWYSQAALDAEIEAALQTYRDETAAQMSDGSEDSMQTEGSQQDESASDDQTEPLAIQVGIRSGVLASEVADLLYELEIIEDRDQFEQRMKDRRLTPNIRTGTYSILRGEDIDTIIDMITFP